MPIFSRSFGSLTGIVLEAAEKLAAHGVSAEVVKLNRIVPLPGEALLASLRKTGRLLVAQECVTMGGPGEDILAAAAHSGVALKRVAICSCGEDFIPHGTVSQLRTLCGLDADSIYQKAMEVMHDGN